jgi:hypothetical protein
MKTESSNEYFSGAQHFVDSLTFSEQLIPEIQKIQEIKDQIETAKTYQTLLDNGLFETRSIYADRVESEIQQFIVGRLQVLLGIKSAEVKTPTDSLFTEEEVGVLKAISKKFLEGQIPKSDPSPPQLKTVKTKEVNHPTLKQVKEEKKDVSLKKTFEKNKSGIKSVSVPVKKKEHGVMKEASLSENNQGFSQVIPPNHPKMPSEQENLYLVQSQILNQGVVLSTSSS